MNLGKNKDSEPIYSSLSGHICSDGYREDDTKGNTKDLAGSEGAVNATISNTALLVNSLMDGLGGTEDDQKKE